MFGRFGGELDFKLTAFQHFNSPILVTISGPTGEQAVAMGFAIAEGRPFGFLVKHPTDPGPLEYLPSSAVIWPPVLMTRPVAEASGVLREGDQPTPVKLNRAQRRRES